MLRSLFFLICGNYFIIVTICNLAEAERVVARAEDEILYTLADLSKHADSSSCFAAINGNVYDFTDFLTKHPGGQHALLRFAGGDATDIFLGIHDENYLEQGSELGFRRVGSFTPSDNPGGKLQIAAETAQAVQPHFAAVATEKPRSVITADRYPSTLNSLPRGTVAHEDFGPTRSTKTGRERRSDKVIRPRRAAVTPRTWQPPGADDL